MAYKIFGIVFPIFAIVLVGFLYARRHAPDMAATNKINIDIFVPALIFDVLSGRDFHFQEYQSLAWAAAAIVLGSGLLAWPVARLLKYQTKTFVPPMMFSNSGNIGLPLALFAFGEQAIPAAVVLFIVENFLHFSVGMRIMDTRASLLAILRVPMVLATLTGLVVALANIRIPGVLAIPIEMMGKVSIPLLLFALGVRLIHVEWSAWRIGVAGAIVCPLTGLVFALPLGLLLDLPEVQFAQLIVFGALPPAVLNYMISERYNQEPHLVASIVMMGNLASVAIIPAVLFFVL